jgi:hypothetical protein
MNGFTSWLGRARAALAGRVERLGRRLEPMSLRLRGVLSRLAGRAVAGAVRDAVRDALGLPPVPPAQSRGAHAWLGGYGDPYRRPGGYTGHADDREGFGAGRAESWRCGQPEDDDDYRREDDTPAEPPVPETWAARLRRAVGVGWQVLCARLLLRPTLAAVPAAVWLGLAAAAAAFAGGRAVAAGVGLAGSALALTDLAAAARDAPDLRP